MPSFRNETNVLVNEKDIGNLIANLFSDSNLFAFQGIISRSI